MKIEHQADIVPGSKYVTSINSAADFGKIVICTKTAAAIVGPAYMLDINST